MLYLPAGRDRLACRTCRGLAHHLNWLDERRRSPPAPGRHCELAALNAAWPTLSPHVHATGFPAGAGLSQWLRDATGEIDAAGRRLAFIRTKRERLITIA